MKTVLLRPEHIDPLAQALYTEWHDFAPWSSVDKIRAYYETCLQGSGLPVAFAAVDGQGRLLGSSALKRHDIAALPQYEYWLGDVFVLPPYRGKGVGKLLVEHCLGAAPAKCVCPRFICTRPTCRPYMKNTAGGKLSGAGTTAKQYRS